MKRSLKKLNLLWMLLLMLLFLISISSKFMIDFQKSQRTNIIQSQNRKNNNLNSHSNFDLTQTKRVSRTNTKFIPNPIVYPIWKILKNPNYDFENKKWNNDLKIQILTPVDSKNASLQYKLVSNLSEWKNVPVNRIIDNLVPSKYYNFRWITKKGGIYSSTKKLFYDWNNKKVWIGLYPIDVNTQEFQQIIKLINNSNIKVKHNLTRHVHDGSIKIILSQAFTFNQGFKFWNLQYILQYKKRDIYNQWKNVPSNGLIKKLAPGIYDFRLKSQKKYYYWNSQNKHIYFYWLLNNSVMVKSGNKIFIPSTPDFEVVKILKDKMYGKINVTFNHNTSKNTSILQYKKTDSIMWNNVPKNGKIENLVLGTYNFRWKSRNNELYVGTSNNFINLDNQVLVYSQKISIPTKLQFIASNNSIIIQYVINTHSQLEYKNAYSNIWIQVPNNGKIENLDIGTYNFRWKSRNNELYVGTSNDYKLLEDKNIMLNPPIPQKPHFNIFDVSFDRKLIGAIVVNNFKNIHSQLEYKKESSNIWIQVPSNGIILNLVSQNYNFRWTSKNRNNYLSTNNPYHLLENIFVSNNLNIKRNSDFTIIRPNYKKEDKYNPYIKIFYFQNSYLKLQYKTRVSEWNVIPNNGIINGLKISNMKFRWMYK